MVEQIRKYLLSKQCILFVSLHINQLINVVATWIKRILLTIVWKQKTWQQNMLRNLFR